MPILTIESLGVRQAGMLVGRLLIGRWPNTAVTIDDRAVSRIHAWIGLQDGHYYVADAGSRTGTFVNGEALRDRYFLADGDEIRVGPAVLHFHIDDVLPEDAEAIDLSPKSAESISNERGVFKDCECGAPLWLPQHFSGVGQCRYCGRSVRMRAAGASPAPTMPIPPPLAVIGKKKQPPAETNDEGDSPRPARIPKSAGPALPPAPAISPAAPLPPSQAPPAAKECGVCHSPITRFDETMVCPSCGLIFHHDCWQENRGCSAYGCSQVGALAHEAQG